MMKLRMFAIAASLLVASYSAAAVVDSFDFAGAEHGDVLGSADNSIIGQTTVVGAGGYTIGEIRWDGQATPEQPASYGNELLLQMTHNAVHYELQLGDGTTYSAGTPFSGSTYLMAGVEVAENDTISFEFFDPLNDGEGADAIWDDLTIDFTNESPTFIDPVAAGYIRIDTTGTDPSDTSVGGAGENYWGIEYGENTGNLPNIDSIEILTAPDVRAADVTFDPFQPGGTFVSNPRDGVTTVNASFSHVDEDHPTRYGQSLLTFGEDDFNPGDSIRFGVDMDGEMTNGADLYTADPSIEIRIVFDDETEAVGYLTELGALSDDATLSSYIDIEVVTLPTNPADFNEDGRVNNADLVSWSGGYGTEDGALHAHGDADGDEDVDGTDFLIWQREYRFGTGGLMAMAAVPEPTTGVLLAIGLVAFLPWRRLLAASAILLLSLNMAAATVQDTFVFSANSPSIGEQSHGNYSETSSSTAASTYTLGEIRWSGVAHSVEDPGEVGSFPSWGNELYARMTHFGTVETYFDIPLGAGGWFNTPTAFSGSIPHFAGLIVNPSDSFQIELYEAADDIVNTEFDVTDAIWDSLTFELTDENLPPTVTAPVADGYIRFSTAGYNPHIYDEDSIQYWRVEYGPDAGGVLPEIVDVTIDVGDPDSVSFDPTDPSGDLDYYFSDQYQTGLTGSDLSQIFVDEPGTIYEDAYGQFHFGFVAGAFVSGDQFRFGSDLDGAPKDGSELRNLDTPIEISITFEGGAEVTGQLIEHGYAGPGEFQFSYVDMAVPAGGENVAIPEPSTFVLFALGLMALVNRALPGHRHR